MTFSAAVAGDIGQAVSNREIAARHNRSIDEGPSLRDADQVAKYAQPLESHP